MWTKEKDGLRGLRKRWRHERVRCCPSRGEIKGNGTLRWMGRLGEDREMWRFMTFTLVRHLISLLETYERIWGTLFSPCVMVEADEQATQSAEIRRTGEIYRAVVCPDELSSTDRRTRRSTDRCSRRQTFRSTDMQMFTETDKWKACNHQNLIECNWFDWAAHVLHPSNTTFIKLSVV